ncbi:gamma-glutamylcyclotransferase family protein [Chromobacterium phragmitis]|uniref:Gamma-glutamylcyclotransferase family protein n=1 Tax=Chromobacterium phragmitis TaxID=2202141 RepID=A0ABV0IVU1_9NEIS
MPRLFSYGTLRQENVQLATFGRRLNGQPARLAGFRLESVAIHDPAVLSASGKAHHPILRRGGAPQDQVDGVVYELSDAELAQADRYEVADYRRVEAALDSGGLAWVYVAAE